MKLPTGLNCALVLVFASGCSLLNTDINLRNDVYQGKPIWESPPLQQLRKAPPRGKKLKAIENPGLSLLIQQVLDPEMITGATIIGQQTFKGTENTYYIFPGNLPVQKDTEPLPPEIVDNPVTKALVWQMASSYSASFLPESEQGKYKLPDLELSTKDFESFVLQLSKSVVAPFHQPWEANSDNRHFKIHAFAVDKTINWEGLFNAYLMNYFNGKFFDRIGGSYSKPKLGLTITNETITAFISVFLEATFDYVILSGKDFKVPIVYEPDENGNPKTFLTKDHNIPTLARVVKKLNNDNPHLPFIVEPVQPDPKKEGITQEKLCVIREISGISGDAAQGASGTLVRLFGGGTGGIAFLNGKISIGDNETLAKVIDTVLENFTKRTTELFISTILYDLTSKNDGKLYYVDNGGNQSLATDEQQEDWKMLKARLDLSKLIGCFFDK